MPPHSQHRRFRPLPHRPAPVRPFGAGARSVSDGLAAPLVLLILFALFLLSVANPAQAAPPRQFVLDTFAIETRDDTLVLRLGVGVDDPDGLRDLLKDGAEMELRGTATLTRRRGVLPDVTLAEKVFACVLRHDTLTREFELRLEGRESPWRDKNLARLLEATWKRLVLPLAPISTLEKGEPHRVSLALSLRHTDVPPWLSRTLFFWSWEVVPDATFTQDFTY
ncbi:DUF4390 domain-containing protein [Nitratidesulfovibrio sp. D1]|uniref:DUF4390 domain-containing protein n=1 Tax=Nitratidesulfovibrio sp. D1 TaxID=3440151 RepID=UPI003EB81A8A